MNRTARMGNASSCRIKSSAGYRYTAGIFGNRHYRGTTTAYIGTVEAHIGTIEGPLLLRIPVLP